MSSINPAFKSASIAICLPGIESSVNLAVTSATLVAPLVTTIKFIRTRIINTIIPITILPPTTNSPKAEIIELTSSGPLCPSLKIDRVVAIFKDSLKRARISISVGNVVKSAGFCTYKEINKTNNDIEREIIKKKSKNPFDKGTIMIVNIATKNATTKRSLENNFSLRFIQVLFLSNKIY